MDRLTEVDELILGRWADTVAFRDAVEELEARLAERFDAGAQSLRPWLEDRGYAYLRADRRNANVNVARQAWMGDKNRPLVWISLGAVLPYGFRKVEEEHPYVWVTSWRLNKPERSRFQELLVERLTGKDGGWLNPDCGRDAPAGRYIRSHGDAERLALARSSDAIEAFAREALAPILELGSDIDAALKAAVR